MDPDNSSDIYSAYAAICRSVYPDTETSVVPMVSEALEVAQSIGDRFEGFHALITGSLVLVGDVLDQIQRR